MGGTLIVGLDSGSWEQLQGTPNYRPRLDCRRRVAAICARQREYANLIILNSACLTFVYEADRDFAEIVRPLPFASGRPRILFHAFKFGGAHAPQ